MLAIGGKGVRTSKYLTESYSLKYPLICVPVVQVDKNAAIQDIKIAGKQGADLIELRIDYLKRYDYGILSDIIAYSNLPVMATTRREDNGGHFPNDKEEERLVTLMDAISAGATIVDVELNVTKQRKKKIIDYARKKGVEIAISYHNFSKTPSFQDAVERLSKMEEQGADLAKMVPTPKNMGDVSNILRIALWARSSLKIPFIIMGMGPIGRITRVLTPLLGSQITFAALNPGKESALSQLTLDETKEIFSQLKAEIGKKTDINLQTLLSSATVKNFFPKFKSNLDLRVKTLQRLS